jgi:transposase
MRAMTNIATPAIADLHAWHEQQNPLVRALTGPVVARQIDTLTTMQSMIDGYALAITKLEAMVHTVQVAAQEAQVAAQAQAGEHAQALQVTKDRIDQLERYLFGQKSERRPRTTDARKEARKRRRGELSDEERKVQREAAAKARQEKLEALRTKVLVVPLGPDVPEGRPLPPEESVIYEWHPGELVRILVRREQRVLPDGRIVTAPPPPQVIEGGSYGPALHAKVAVDKCLDSMPLRRQERAFERIGAPLPVSVLCALFHRSAVVVEPLYKAMVAHVGTSEHVSADETPQPVLDEEKVRTGWMWVFATDDALLYVYSPSRGGKVAEGVLGHSKGTLTVDGHTGYNLVTKKGRRERGGCWSHGRRGLFEARGYAEALVDGLLAQIGELFYVEHLAIEQQIVGTEAHLALRKERSAPVVALLLATLEEHVGAYDARSSLAKAMRYLLNQREPLSLFLRDARVPIHNNLSEQALRIVALLRKNALFVGSDESGEHLAMLLSMTATCRLHGVDPERWLADVLIQVSEPGITVEDLLPWNWKTRRGPTSVPVFDTT